MAFDRAKIGRLILNEPGTLRGGATLWALDETTPAGLAANRAYFGEPVAESGTVTSLDVAASSYDAGLQHRQYSLRGSTTVSPLWLCNGEWHVWRGGDIIHSEYKLLDFGWLGEEGDRVECRIAERDGSVGAWVSDTFSLTAYDLEKWVNAATGSDANPGTEASPYATIGPAKTAMAALTAGQEGCIWVAGSATYTMGATSVWSNGDVVARRVSVRWDGSGTKPRIETTDVTVFHPGQVGALLIDGLIIDPNSTSLANCIGFDRDGAAGVGYNIAARNCDFVDGYNSFQVGIVGATGTAANRDGGSFDFLAIVGCTSTSPAEYHLFGFDLARYVLLLGNTWGVVDWGAQQTFRCYDWTDCVVLGDELTSGNGFRFLCGPDPSLGVARLSASRVRTTTTTATSVGMIFAADEPATDVYYAQDVRIVDCYLNGANGGIVVDRNQLGGQNSVDLLRFQVLDCVLRGLTIVHSTTAGADGGQIRDVEVRNNLIMCGADGAAVGIVATQAQLPSGAITAFCSNVAHYSDTGDGFGSTRGILSLTGGSWDGALLESRLVESDGNHIGKVDGFTLYLYVVESGGSFGRYSLAAWQAEAPTLDTLSTVTNSTTMNFVDGTNANRNLRDYRLASSSAPHANMGVAVPYAVDAEGNLRFGTTPDAGPYEFGATEQPDLPAGGGPTTLFADGLGLFAIFGEAGAVARVAADGTGFVAVTGDAEADARIAADGAGFVALWGDAEVSETIGGVDPPGPVGQGYVSIWGDAEAAARIAVNGAGFVSLFGDADAGASIVADGVGFVSLFGDADANVIVPTNNADGVVLVSLWGDADALVGPASTGRGVQIVNDSADLFEGVVSINTDLPVPDAYGQRNGITFVRGLPSGLDTQRVDLIVSIPAGGTITLPDLIAETTIAPTPPTVPPDFFGGDPQIGGVPFTKHSEETDGLTVVTEWRLRSGVWIVYLITYNVPGEPWALVECLTLHSNPTSASLREFWPAWLVTWGNGTVEFLGRTSDGSVVAAARGFGDGQCVLRPGLAWWPGRYRNAQDTANVAAMRTHKVLGHGIQRLYPDGTPPEAPGHATWAAGALAGAIARLDDWGVSPNNILPQTGPTGGQADQGFTRAEPYYHPSALLAVYLEACRWGGKPCNHAELNGDVLDLAARPRFRAYDGRPHPPTTQDEPGQPGSGMLGKPGELNPPVHTPLDPPVAGEGWNGPGFQHWWLNGLVAGCRYTGRRGPQKLLEFNSNLYLASRFPPGFGSNTDVFSTRDLMLEGCNTTHFWVNLRNRTMATTLRDRARVRANGVWVNWINPVHPLGWPASYWQVYNTTPTASTPNLPAYIPWQQGPGAYYLDLCRRTLGGMESLVGGIVAGAYQVLDDVWTFEFSPTFGVNRWVEYEQIQLPPPYGAGIRGRDGNWTVDWFPPLIALIRRIEPTNTKANEIWAQMLAQLGGGGQWIPPEEQVGEVINYATGTGFLSLWGESEAEGAPISFADGLGWVSVWSEGDALNEIPSVPPQNPGPGGPIIMPPRRPGGRAPRPWGGGGRWWWPRRR